jgi:short-chain fatty acids transporter
LPRRQIEDLLISQPDSGEQALEIVAPDGTRDVAELPFAAYKPQLRSDGTSLYVVASGPATPGRLVRWTPGEDPGRGGRSSGSGGSGGPDASADRTLAERLEDSRMVAYPLALAGLGFVAWFFYTRGFALDLNIMNFTLIMAGMVLYGSPAAYMRAKQRAVTTSTGIIVQFPFYAGIMGMMSLSGLVAVFANAIVSVSTPLTFPLASMFSAGFVNFFVPSAGGQWAVQGPILVEAAQALDVSMGQTIVAFAYGDQLTNMVQPFWALPLLGITGLEARDLLGYTAVIMLVALVIFAVGVTVLPLVGWMTPGL